MKQGLLNFFIGLAALIVCNSVSSQTTYTWNLAGGGSWTTAANWTPARSTPAANDILRFTNGGTKTITNVPTQTIGKLQVTGNTNITLQSVNTGNSIITVSATATDAIDVDAGSTLQIVGIQSGGSGFGLTITTANSSGLEANIDGTVIVKYDNPSRPTTLGVFTKGGSNATINFNGGSIYQHDVDASSIPTANWNITSTCYITGLTAAAPIGLTQSFGNVTYECANHAGLINLNSTLTSIAGDFTVKHAGEVQGPRTLNGVALSLNSNLTLNIGGNLIVDHPYAEATWLIMTTGTANVTINIGGNFLISNTGSGYVYFDFKFNSATAMGSLVINLTGNLTMAGGYLDMGYQASSYSVGTELRIGGNLSVSATSTIITSGANILNGKIIFNSSGTQTVYEGAARRIAFVSYQVNGGSTTEFLSNLYLYEYSTATKSSRFSVLNGGILDMSTFTLHGYSYLSGSTTAVGVNNSFTLNSGAGIISANSNGIHLNSSTAASISAAIATRTFSSGANYTYDGTVLQNSGTFTTTPVANQVNNLTINNITGANTTGVTLQQEFKVAGVCTFISGVFTTTNTNILTLNDNATYSGIDLDAVSTNLYVNGPMKKIGNDAFAFPVGKISHGCRPIYISAPSNTTDEFRAELIRGNAGLLGPITAPGLLKVSGCEYWYLDRLVGSSNVNISLSWNGESPCNAQSYVTDLPNLVAAHFNGTSWDTYGNDGGTTGNAVKGTVTWNYAGPYNASPTQTPWSLGSLLWYTNPLTVKFINLTASERNSQVKLDWGNVAETNIEKYIIEHSTDGRSFIEITNTNARLNNGNRTDYSWWHGTPATGLNFYRIKALEYSGEVTYSSVARIVIGRTINEFTVYPNPVKDGQINIAVSSLAKGKYEISVLNMAGQKILQRSLDHSGGSIILPIALPSTIKAGLYSIKVSGGDQKFIKTFLIE